jgi:hypothetical protein
MARRKPYTKLVKTNQIRADHVKGMGDVVFKGFQCLNSECQEFIFVRKDEIGDDFEIACPACETVIRSGDETQFYEYELVNLEDGSVIERGTFTILHDDYIEEAQEYKYCIICNTMKPVHLFDHHRARKSGRQGECRLCKAIYNSIKNQTRLTDQHREAAQKRRMYLDLSGSRKINSQEVYKRFGYRCFKCNKDLRGVSAKERPLDHTLPAVFLWPLTTENATLLCREHNGEKSGKWPSEYYSDEELKKLSILTGIPYTTLAGSPHYNPEAIARLRDSEHVDRLLSKYASYMPEIIRLRNRILEHEGVDFFEYSTTISPAWVRKADREYQRVIRQEDETNTEPNTDEK